MPIFLTIPHTSTSVSVKINSPRSNVLGYFVSSPVFFFQALAVVLGMCVCVWVMWELRWNGNSVSYKYNFVIAFVIFAFLRESNDTHTNCLTTVTNSHKQICMNGCTINVFREIKMDVSVSLLLFLYFYMICVQVHCILPSHANSFPTVGSAHAFDIFCKHILHLL